MTTQSSSRLIRSLHAFTHATRAAVIFVGCPVLVRWMSSIQVLKSLIPDAISVNPTVALCSILAGVSLWLVRMEQAGSWTHPLALVCAAIVALVGLRGLGATAFGWDVGISHFLFREEEEAAPC